MSAKEWDLTPWWEQRILRQGLESERPWIGRAVMLEKADVSLRPEVFEDFAPPALAATVSEKLYQGDEYKQDLHEWGMQVDNTAIDRGVVTPVYMGENSWIRRLMQTEQERKNRR